MSPRGGVLKMTVVNLNKAEPSPMSQVFTTPLESFHFNPLTRLVNIYLGSFWTWSHLPGTFQRGRRGGNVGLACPTFQGDSGDAGRRRSLVILERLVGVY